jgi:3-oxoacyl-[acyl-carrier-protein] synthase-3
LFTQGEGFFITFMDKEKSMQLYHSKITGSGHYYPPKIVTNKELIEKVDTTEKWIVQRTGILERRIADKETEYPSGMAEHAARMAIKDAGIDKEDIDLIIFSVTMPDQFFPNTSSTLQGKLKIESNCACMDLNAACTGWLYAMVLSNSLIQTGVYKNILIVGAEMSSNFNNWEDRNTCVLFGDGSGAVVLSRSDDENSTIIASHLTCDGSKIDALALPKGGAKFPITHEILDNKEQFVTMDGKVVFKNAVKTMAQNSVIALEKAGISKDEVNWFIPHQANLRIIETTAGLLDFPMEKVITTVEKYANTSSASIPATLSEAAKEGKIKRGDLILMAAFGSGLTSGAILLRY